MSGLNVIDRFLETFIRYIDSGFGLLSGDVAFLTTVLIGIDITLVGLFWALDGEGHVLGRLARKTLYVGTFALFLNQFATLADILFRSFAGLGLRVTGNGISAQDLLRPGKLAVTGFEAAWPLLAQAGSMIGFTTFFDNIITVLVLLIAWVVVIFAFFVLAVQLFITVLEFKLTTLAGFVLVPFGLWSKTSFLAERVLGNVITAGIKVMVLAVIVGIGASFFGDFRAALDGQDPSVGDAMSLVLASVALFGLGIFGPAIAAGLVSGAPQLGAGAAIGTAGAVVGGGMLIGAGIAGTGRVAALGALAAVQAATNLSGGAVSAYRTGRAMSGADGLAGMAAGVSAVARAGGQALTERRSAAAFRPGAPAAGPRPFSGGPGGSAPAGDTTPEWARRLQSEQRWRAHRHSTVQALKDGDKPGAGANPDLEQAER